MCFFGLFFLHTQTDSLDFPTCRASQHGFNSVQNTENTPINPSELATAQNQFAIKMLQRLYDKIPDSEEKESLDIAIHTLGLAVEINQTHPEIIAAYKNPPDPTDESDLEDDETEITKDTQHPLMDILGEIEEDHPELIKEYEKYYEKKCNMGTELTDAEDPEINQVMGINRRNRELTPERNGPEAKRKNYQKSPIPRTSSHVANNESDSESDGNEESVNLSKINYHIANNVVNNNFQVPKKKVSLQKL